MELTKNDQFFISAATAQVREWLSPVPFFVLRPGMIHRENEFRISSIVSVILENKELPREMGIPPDKFKILLTGVAGFELWKRGWIMRLQWVLQILAFSIVWTFIWQMISTI